MKPYHVIASLVGLLLIWIVTIGTAVFGASGGAETAVATTISQPTGKSETVMSAKMIREEMVALEKKRQQLAEREAALAAKEEELKKLAAGMDSKIRELETAKKLMESSLRQKQGQENDRFKKILRVYKGLKPEEAGRLMDKLDETMAIEMLNRMDQKTAVKLIPFLNQPRVLKWTRENLQVKANQ